MGFDEEGSCYFGGQYDDELEFENGPTFTNAGANTFLGKFLSDGTYDWCKNIPCLNEFSSIMGISVYNKNSVLATGRIYGGVMAFGPITLTSVNSNAFLVLLGNDLPVGISNQEVTENEITIYPNPASEKIVVLFNVYQGEPATCIITDINGKTVLSKTIRGETPLRVLLPPLEKGIYFLSVETNGKKYYQKFVVNQD
jgi:hypothetical protein